jgi:hypothetical protein
LSAIALHRVGNDDKDCKEPQPTKPPVLLPPPRREPEQRREPGFGIREFIEIIFGVLKGQKMLILRIC